MAGMGEVRAGWAQARGHQTNLTNVPTFHSFFILVQFCQICFFSFSLFSERLLLIDLTSCSPANISHHFLSIVV